MNSLYLDNGYVNIKGILDSGYTFNSIIGGRGTGKTYGILKHCLENNIKFFLIRNLQTQIDNLAQPTLNPFNELNKDMYLNIQPRKSGKNLLEFANEDDEGNRGEIVCVACSLKGISHLRGFSASDFKLIFFDEFVPEKTEFKIKNPFYALMNCYETINRNRELNGEPPCKLLLCSNSENIVNDIFIGLGVVKRCLDARKKGIEEIDMQDKSLKIVLLNNSPISEKKKETALYKLVGTQSEFFKMSVENEFYSFDESNIHHRPLNEFRKITSIGELSFYEHKNTPEIYTILENNKPEYNFSETDKKRFKHHYPWIFTEYLQGGITFSDIETKVLFDKLLES